MAKIELKPLPPAEAIAYFNSKGFATSFDWRDVWKEDHAKTFTVAKTVANDILIDIHSGLRKAKEEGIPFEQYRKELTPTLQSKGWWGRQPMADPLTGEIKNVQLGSPHRLSIIYDTNLRSAYAAGRWQNAMRMAANVKKRGETIYLRYVIITDGNTRPEHAAWYEIILPIDHPFWQTHYPPNGWRCRCIVQVLTKRDMDRRGLEVSSDPEIQKVPWTNKRTGVTTDVPEGIDPGFDFNIGQAYLKPFTPPPANGAPIPGIPGANNPPLLDPRPQSVSRVLPEGMSEEAYAQKFLEEFGAKIGKPIVFKDVTGSPLVISDDLFRQANGSLKIKKRERHLYVRMLAETIKSPDEIWLKIEELRSKPGTFVTRRRYIARWEIEGHEHPGVAVFEESQEGWKGVTAFQVDHPKQKQLLEYLKGLREGAMLYRRKT